MYRRIPVCCNNIPWCSSTILYNLVIIYVVFLQTQVQQALCNVVRDCKNFKVRINAALAFSVPATRGCYGNTAQLTYIWDSLLVAVSAAEHVTDFAEYRYRDNFTDQVLIEWYTLPSWRLQIKTTLGPGMPMTSIRNQQPPQGQKETTPGQVQKKCPSSV